MLGQYFGFSLIQHTAALRFLSHFAIVSIFHCKIFFMNIFCAHSPAAVFLTDFFDFFVYSVCSSMSDIMK